MGGKTVVARAVFFLASVCLTLGASIASMQGGFDLTMGQLGQVPAVAWLMSIGNGAIAALNGKLVTGGGPTAKGGAK